MPPMNRSTKSPLMRYRIYLQLEKSLRPATVESYLSDVNKLALFLGGNDALPELKGVTVSGSVELAPGSCAFFVL